MLHLIRIRSVPARAAWGALLIAVLSGGACAGEETLLVTGRAIAPAAVETGVGSFPCNMALSPDGRFLVVTDAGYREQLSVLGAGDGRLIARIDFNATRTDGSKKKAGLYYGLAFGSPGPAGTPLYVSRGSEETVSIFTLAAHGALTDTGRILHDPSGISGFRAPNVIAGLALSADGTRLYAVHNVAGPLTGQLGSMSILDVAKDAVVSRVVLPGFPLAAARVRGPDGREKLYVTSERDGLVAVVDPESTRVVRQIPTGDHPTALLANPRGSDLYVANSGSDTITVLDARSDSVASTISLRPAGVGSLPGETPTGLALAPDGSRLYVALGDMNAIAVVDLAARRVSGYLPTGWYPTSVVVSEDGRRLFVACAKGGLSRTPNGHRTGPDGAWGRYIEDVLEGTVRVLPVPDATALRELTTRALENARAAAIARPRARFRNPGIKHVIYVIKENRTYDQVLGDVKAGNGDPSLCLFPRAVTPNLHALAERFVLLDNFYDPAEVSADGWNWSVSGMASEYTERNTPYNYSGRGRAYDSEGRINNVPVDLLGIPDVARAPGGYLWDRLVEKGIPFRNYGFYVDPGSERIAGVPVGTPAGAGRAAKRALIRTTDLDFRWFDLNYADGDAWVAYDCPAPSQLLSHGAFNARSRIEEWRREFAEYVRNGDLPPLTTVRLGRDHTAATKRGSSSPRAMVADNDYAVGELVETLSKSPYWRSTAVFVVEDDAQGGYDHVDAHRSTAYVLSPFVRQATVDHRFYNTDSVLRTIELLLGLDPMCQYDAIASPLDVFGGRPDNDAPYSAILPSREIVAEVNGAAAFRSAESDRLRFDVADAVPDALMNEILWGAIRGPGAPPTAAARQ